MSPDRTDELFRSVNDRIRQLDGAVDTLYFVCECPDPSCFRTVPLEIEDFDAARADGEPIYAADCPRASRPSTAAT